jgi:hypothetical protein
LGFAIVVDQGRTLSLEQLADAREPEQLLSADDRVFQPVFVLVFLGQLIHIQFRLSRRKVLCPLQVIEIVMDLRRRDQPADFRQECR